MTAFFFLERPAVSHSSLSSPPSAPSASSSALQCRESDPCIHKASQTAGTSAAMHCMCRIQIEGLAYALLRSDGTEGRLDMKLAEEFLQQSYISWTTIAHQRVIWQRLVTDLGAVFYGVQMRYAPGLPRDAAWRRRRCSSSWCAESSRKLRNSCASSCCRVAAAAAAAAAVVALPVQGSTTQLKQ